MSVLSLPSLPAIQVRKDAIRAVRSVVSQAHQELSQGSADASCSRRRFESMDSEAISSAFSYVVHPSLYFYRFSMRESRHVGEYSVPWS